MSAPVIFEKRDGGGFIKINRPDVRNAINAEVSSAIADFLIDVKDSEDIKYIVIQGEGSHFSAGGDLASYAERLHLGPRAMQNYMRRRVRGSGECFQLLQSLNIPVISLVRGAAAGAGLGFILASDFVLSDETAVMVFAHTKVGLSLDMGTTYFLPRVVGLKRARQLALTGATLDAREAQRLGIIDEVHPADALDDALAIFIGKLSAAAPRAAARSKALLNHSLDNDMVQQLEAEVTAIGECVGEPDFAEGLTAFVEKRKAKFTGKKGGETYAVPTT